MHQRSIWSAARCLPLLLVLMSIAAPAQHLGTDGAFSVVDTAVFNNIVGWDWQYSQVRCVDGRNCVAVLNLFAGFRHAAIRASSDGGDTWRTVLLHSRGEFSPDWTNDGVRIRDISTPTARLWLAVADTAWAHEDTSVSPSVTRYQLSRAILRTTDAGATWRSELWVPYPANPFLSITMLDSANGVVVGIDSAFRTTDGGSTWTPFSYPPIESPGNIDKLWMFSPMHYRALTYDFANKTYVRFETTNGGGGWSRDVISQPLSYDRICFINEDIGWLASWENTDDVYIGRSFVKKTTDGGLTWRTMYETEHRRPTGLRSVNFADDLHGFAGGTGGEFLYTSDGGANWLRYDSVFWYDGAAVGEYASFTSIAPLSAFSALIGVTTTKLARYRAPAASASDERRGQAAAALIVTPNPAHDMLHLSGPLSPRATVRVLDLLGRSLRMIRPDNSGGVGVDIDVADLPAGMYLVRVDGMDRGMAAWFIKR